MPRPRIHPTVRFETEIRIWNSALQYGSARLECGTSGKAVNLITRLNMCRAALRDEVGSGKHAYDGFITHRYENVITIRPKPYFDLSKLTDMHGNPIQAPDEAIIPRPPVGEHFQPSIQPAAKPVRRTHEFDHSRPFGLDIAPDDTKQ